MNRRPVPRGPNLKKYRVRQDIVHEHERQKPNDVISRILYKYSNSPQGYTRVNIEERVRAKWVVIFRWQDKDEWIKIPEKIYEEKSMYVE
jgi:hypothetical protein